MAGRLRIGFVGAGFMGQLAHLRNFVNLRGCEVVGLAEPRRETARRVAERYGVPAVYPTHRELLEHEQLDGIVVIQPEARLPELLPEIYGHVPCVLTEKPLAPSVAEGERLVELVHERRTKHMVGYHKRSDPATVKALELINGFRISGELGQLRYVRLLVAYGDWIAGADRDFIDAGDPHPDAPAPWDLGGYTPELANEFVRWANYFVHQVNLARALVGERVIVAHAEPNGTLLVLRSDSGVPAVVELTPYRTAGWHETALVAFEAGWVRLSLPAPLVIARAGMVEVFRGSNAGEPETVEAIALPPVHAMRCQAERFAAVCAGEADPPVGPEEALEDLMIVREYVLMRQAGSVTSG